jgi:hypothetical protein
LWEHREVESMEVADIIMAKAGTVKPVLEICYADR